MHDFLHDLRHLLEGGPHNEWIPSGLCEVQRFLQVSGPHRQVVPTSVCLLHLGQHACEGQIGPSLFENVLREISIHHFMHPCILKPSSHGQVQHVVHKLKILNHLPLDELVQC